jgi:hypothetical protein
MISKQWRERLTYTAMSVFVGWHAVAMMIAPAPDGSGFVKSLRGLFEPYLTLFRLDNAWDFFAPNVGKGSQFRYVIKDASGEGHVFVPHPKLSWFHPSYIWFKDWYETLMDHPDVYGEAFAKLFCKEHASLKPVSVMFQEVAEQDYWPEDRLAGKNPMDPEHVKVNTVKTFKCPDS